MNNDGAAENRLVVLMAAKAVVQDGRVVLSISLVQANSRKGNRACPGPSAFLLMEWPAGQGNRCQRKLLFWPS